MKRIAILSLVLALGLIFVQPLQAGTIALYHFDEATSGVTPDAVGNHPGTLYGDAAISAGGKFGNGLSLDGSGDYVRLGNVHQAPVKDTSAGTVEAWVKLSAAPSGIFAVLGSGREYGGTFDDGWFLGRHTDYSSNLVFMIWARYLGSDEGYWVFADSHISPGDLVGGWHHLAGTWGAGGVQVWVDGVLKDTNPYTAGLPNPSYQTALVGADSWTWCTPGMIDELMISDIQRNLAVPIPGAFWLLGSGILGLAGWRRLRKG